MFRPSTERGMPALGCAARGREVTARTRDGVEHGNRSILQLQPITSAPQSASFAAKSRIGTVEAVRIFVDGYGRDDRQLGIDVARRQHRLVQLLDGAERLQDQQIDAAFSKRFNLFAKCRAGFVK